MKILITTALLLISQVSFAGNQIINETTIDYEIAFWKATTSYLVPDGDWDWRSSPLSSCDLVEVITEETEIPDKPNIQDLVSTRESLVESMTEKKENAFVGISPDPV